MQVKSERKYQRKCIMAAEADTNLGGGDIPLQISSQLNIPFSNGNAPTDGLEEEDENNEDDDATPATNSLKTAKANLSLYALVPAHCCMTECKYFHRVTPIYPSTTAPSA